MMSNPALGTEDNRAALQKMQQEVLSYLIDRELIVQERRELGLDVQEMDIALEKWLEPIRKKASIGILFQKEER